MLELPELTIGEELIDGVDSVHGMGEQMRSLSSRKLDEVEALPAPDSALWLIQVQRTDCRRPSPR